MSDTNDTGHLVPVQIPGASMPIQTDGKRLAAFRPMVDFLGLDYSSQLAKLKSKSWATMAIFTTVGADGKTREMVGIDRRTTGMWLATLDENRVAEDRRADLRAYQAEAADALDAYFHKGGAINPRADEHQINALIFQSRAQMELCQAAKGLIHPDHLEAKARVVLARGLGEHAELDPTRKPLYAKDFLKEKNLSRKKMASTAGMFGKRVKAAYIETHGREPHMYPLDLPNGQVREVNAYTEADRPLLERVWQQFYAPLTLDNEVIS
ncbi:phage antirepressor N-terminal domain-containing protein [Rhodococcus aetherivorans]|uniref:phage antirepressor N-terminal domain-containing protein n=1 Tax=Rhodococcus aetherivorans TaxID=191292 RepID=UPI0002D21CA2|nr:phage antirepressor N-terminal domain-containing protein [Rhodococcus aetherivorans]CCW09873.1 putative prophage antirepressor [Rhodococcus aetherivorans]